MTAAGDHATRVLLFTGKGGVGKTTLAAGTAVLLARSGQRTLVVSTDAAHSLADAFGVSVRGDTVAVEERLWVHQVDAQRRFVESWSEVQGYLRSVLDAAGVDPIAAEELTVIPGAEEVLALLELERLATGGDYDVVVVDCAPTAETLRLLALPEALSWYMQRIWPVERRVVKALRPVLARGAGVPMPRDDVFDAVERLHADLGRVHTLLTSELSTVRLVLTPEVVVMAEARRALTTLSLFGYRVDGVVANRVFPVGGDDPWLQGWVAAQKRLLDQVSDSFAALPLWVSAYAENEPVGADQLADVAAAAYAGAEPLPAVAPPSPVGFRRTRSGAVLSMSLPHADRAGVDLDRVGDDLVVTLGSYRRVLTLPSGLTRFDVTGARVGSGQLQVTFEETTA